MTAARVMRVVTIVAMSLPLVALAQTGSDDSRVEILGADRLDYVEGVAQNAQRLIGHARFRHGGATMSCDSAYIYDDQSVKAFGHVGIRQGDTLSISGDRLDYTGKDRLATITDNVRLSDRDMDLTTDLLTYDLRNRMATYVGGGTLTSRKEKNTLTSDRGSYHAGAHRFIFSGDVVLVGPERTIVCDTLHYTTTTGMAEFFGPTAITAGDTRMWCRRGWYDTRNDVADFTQRARVLNNGQELHGDSLHYERATGLGDAFGNVLVLDTADGLMVLGDRGQHNEADDRAWVTGRAEMRMRMGDDTLHLHGDTLVAFPDSSGRRIHALHRVRFFKSDLQGACDTMVYSDADSVIHFLGTPVIWSGDDQLTGRDVRIALRDGKAHRLFIEREAFLASQVDSLRFDQVTGTSMTGFFDNNELQRLLAEGNCRTVYFAREEGTDSTGAAPKLIGMNRVDCSRIRVELNEGEADVIAFLTDPDGTMYPLEQAPPEELRLRGFHWRGSERPADRMAIFPQ